MTEKVMSPSMMRITNGQIAKFLDLLNAGLRKSQLPSGPIQQVLENQGSALVEEFVSSVRRHVEVICNFIVRHVVVNRNITPQQALDATGRKQITNTDIVNAMPMGDGDKVKAVFFRPRPKAYGSGGYLDDDMVEKEFEALGLVPLDPISLLAINRDDPIFADEHPNITIWKDSDGKWCFLSFVLCNEGRVVSVDRSGVDWLDDYWWFAGIRK